MAAHSRRTATLTLEIGGIEFQVQCRHALVQDNTGAAEQFLLYGADTDSFYEPAEPSYVLDLEFYADWRPGGISDFLWSNRDSTVAFRLVHHEGLANEAVNWSGSVLLRAPNAVGTVRTTELTVITLPIVGTPTYARGS